MFEDRGGVLTLVGGLVALTVVATGLAMVMEKRKESSNRSVDAEKTIAEESHVMDSLKDDLTRAKERWTEVSGRGALDEKYKAAKAAADGRAAKLAEIRDKHTAIKSSLQALQGDFTKYRDEYVNGVRTAAEEEQIDTLKLINGREYSKVVIRRVTSDGLEIRHEFGSARVAADDLDEKWNSRFLWR